MGVTAQLLFVGKNTFLMVDLLAAMEAVVAMLYSSLMKVYEH
ncbi:hypothetical protein GCM10025857_57670 [Alicyclobacillus contaminans]|nr:hypothetical protein GCM10025857_57670 [Alicyclobacillus contaminans]